MWIIQDMNTKETYSDIHGWLTVEGQGKPVTIYGTLLTAKRIAENNKNTHSWQGRDVRIRRLVFAD